jgi:hypothetical protein
VIAVARWLEAQGAYRDLVAWAEPHGDDWSAAWDLCPRGDWLLAIAAGAAGPTPGARAALVRACCGCAELALEVASPDGTPEALAAARAWAASGGLDPDLEAGAREHEGALEAAFATCADPVAQAALAAVLATLAARREPREAPGAAAAAVQASVLAAGECAFEAVVRFVHRTSAERVRAALPMPDPPA